VTFRASEFHFYYQLKRCALRVYLREQGISEQEADAYHELLKRLGLFHERRHLASMGAYFDASGSEANTRTAVTAGHHVIYQPFMRVVSSELGEIIGQPDFFILQENGYEIRDCKLSRRFSEEEHPEIFRQLELYGWLFEQTFDRKPSALRAYMGDSELREVPYYPAHALQVLTEIQRIKGMDSEPYDPVGWSKCRDCAFHEFCWNRAKERKDVAMLPDVDQSLARTLHAEEIDNYEQIVARYNVDSLAELKKPAGNKMRRVGQAAATILLQAESFISEKLILARPVSVKRTSTLVMFDVEGIPPHLDYSEQTYLWGLKTFGDNAGEYTPAIAGFGANGDRDGWSKFLENCRSIFNRLGDIPFVHWTSYEKTQVTKYLDKFGDVDGIGSKVIANLSDLHKVVDGSVILPVPTYGLKVIERVAGYERKLEDAGGKWSMAKYIEAIETGDPAMAHALIEEIATYNEEDLDALWAVYCWLDKLAKA
jgi:predicted RecB family nuclease